MPWGHPVFTGGIARLCLANPGWTGCLSRCTAASAALSVGRRHHHRRIVSHTQTAASLRRSEGRYDESTNPQAIGRAAITAAQGEARQTAENVEATTASVGAALREATIPGIGMVPEVRSAWMQWISETTLLGNRLSHDLLRQIADQNRRLIVETMEFWMAHTARIMQTTMHLGQASLQGFGTDPGDGSRPGGNRVGGVYKD